MKFCARPSSAGIISWIAQPFKSPLWTWRRGPFVGTRPPFLSVSVDSHFLHSLTPSGSRKPTRIIYHKYENGSRNAKSREMQIPKIMQKWFLIILFPHFAIMPRTVPVYQFAKVTLRVSLNFDYGKEINSRMVANDFSLLHPLFAALSL